MREIEIPDTIQERKVIPFGQDGINFIIFEDREGITHLEIDFRQPQPNLRILEADTENPLGHELRIYSFPKEPID